MSREDAVDICLFLEGTYPYVTGGVSQWMHDMLSSLSEYTFAIVAIIPPGSSPQLKYTLPPNVKSIINVELQHLPDGDTNFRSEPVEELMKRIEMPLMRMQHGGKLSDLKEICGALNAYGSGLGANQLLFSEAAWRLIVRMYSSMMGESSFLNFFWSWKGLLSGLYTVLLSPLPEAKVYHALCTGYAGLFLARAKLEREAPCLLTEHGIYTNERRIEITAASWLNDLRAMDLAVDRPRFLRDLKDFWIDTFKSYSHLTYEAASYVITLYQGNVTFQILDGAPKEKIRIIPNGIDVAKYEAVEKRPHKQPTVALIGRVVPIKDVKSFLHAVSLAREIIPDLKALVLGSYDEDPLYYEECVELMHTLKLDEVVTFTGKVHVVDYLPDIDLLVLSSISEVMPLTVLEGGAAGIPSVCTHVGACSELLYGREDEEPKIGEGGIICPIANPEAIAKAVVSLLLNHLERKEFGRKMQERTRRYYQKSEQDAAYRSLYSALMEGRAWQG